MVLSYQIATSNDSSVIDYKIPAGYIQAIFNEWAEHSNSTHKWEKLNLKSVNHKKWLNIGIQEANARRKIVFSSWAFPKS